MIKNKNISLHICFLELSEEFRKGLKKRVRIIHGERDIGVQAIEVRLYFLVDKSCLLYSCTLRKITRTQAYSFLEKSDLFTKGGKPVIQKER